MADERLFQALSFWNLWGEGTFESGIERDAREELLPWLDRPEVIAVCGMRRCGKSTLMRQLVQALVERGVPPRDTLFVSFEEPIFLERPLDVAALDRVFDTYFELGRPGAVPYLFLDEIQNVDGWERWVRSRSETGRARIAVSGSSSQLTDPDLATVLTGRHFTRTLWPLSFGELLRFSGIELRDRADLLAGASRIRQELVRYLRYGGLPEVVLLAEEELRAPLLKQYFRDLLYRDVVSRHQIRDVRALETLAHHYLANTGNLVTYNRLKNTFGLAMDQVRSYTRYLEESYLIRTVPRFSYKTASQARAPRKVYATDVGLRNAVAFRFSPDLGRIAETVVFNHLARDDDARIFYFQGRGECDFLVWKGTRPELAIQVCYQADETLPKRELAGLEEAMAAVGASEGLLLTEGLDEAVRDDEGCRIRALPLWRWLCDGVEAVGRGPAGEGA